MSRLRRFILPTIPITGTFFAKRNWLFGKRYGFFTPGDMFACYYNNEAVRWLGVITAFLYAMFYSAVQQMAAGALFQVVAGVPFTFGCIFPAFVVWFYVATGGDSTDDREAEAGDRILLSKDRGAVVGRLKLVYRGVKDGMLTVEAILLDLDPEYAYPHRFSPSDAEAPIHLGGRTFRLVSWNRARITLELLA